jgi:hypothetical protein
MGTRLEYILIPIGFGFGNEGSELPKTNFPPKRAKPDPHDFVKLNSNGLRAHEFIAEK